jgi:hypothetical protein
MNQPHVGPLDPKPGDNGGPPLEPTRVLRFVEGESWFELEPVSLEILAYGSVSEQHPDLR